MGLKILLSLPTRTLGSPYATRSTAPLETRSTLPWPPTLHSPLAGCSPTSPVSPSGNLPSSKSTFPRPRSSLRPSTLTLTDVPTLTSLPTVLVSSTSAPTTREAPLTLRVEHRLLRLQLLRSWLLCRPSWSSAGTRPSGTSLPLSTRWVRSVPSASTQSLSATTRAPDGDGTSLASPPPRMLGSLPRLDGMLLSDMALPTLPTWWTTSSRRTRSSLPSLATKRSIPFLL